MAGTITSRPSGVSRLRGKLDEGLDIKADGGYVVAPPSTHESGKQYTTETSFEAPLVEMPGWMLKMLTKHDSEPKLFDVIPEGTRDDTLTSVGGTLRAQGLDTPAIVLHLHDVNAKKCTPPLGSNEVDHVAQSVSRHPAGDNRFTLSDTGNAERLVEACGERLRCCRASGHWYIYDGKRWNSQEGLTMAHRFAMNTAKSLYISAAKATDSLEHTKLVKQARVSESSARIKGMLDGVKHIDPIAVSVSDFDSDPLVLNCLNGTLDLRTGDLHAHQAVDLITKRCPVEYVLDAQDDMWDRFLQTSTQGNQELLDFLQVAAGYTLTGNTAETFRHGDQCAS